MYETVGVVASDFRSAFSWVRSTSEVGHVALREEK
jgi:hypothetical protein